MEKKKLKKTILKIQKIRDYIDRKTSNEEIFRSARRDT